MPRHLVIIEAPGKLKSLSAVLFAAGLRDVVIVATIGHIASNPNGLNPLAITPDYRETQYALRADRANVVRDIQAAARQADVIYLATDDDQEGDVIARDVAELVLKDHAVASLKRLRLRSLSANEVRHALTTVTPLEPLHAAQGDARRCMDRLIGGLSTREAAVGRVQGSLLVMLDQKRPVVATATYAVADADGGADWIAQVPVFRGDPTPITEAPTAVLNRGSTQRGVMASSALNHDDIILSASFTLDEDPGAIDKAMQTLYEKGRMSYPRAKDRHVSPDAFRRLQAVARLNGAGFDPSLFSAIREQTAIDGAHEAPNPIEIDIPINRDQQFMSIEDRVLVHITRQLIMCGIGCTVERPTSESLSGLPEAWRRLPFYRVQQTGHTLWAQQTPVAGLKKWTPAQSLLHFMAANQLGRPSTIMAHINKFLSRDLIDESLDLTSKGRQWCNHISGVFGHQNISKIIENFVDSNKAPPPDMVAEMVRLCGLVDLDSSGRLFTNQVSEELSNEHEISSVDLS